MTLSPDPELDALCAPYPARSHETTASNPLVEFVAGHAAGHAGRHVLRSSLFLKRENMASHEATLLAPNRRTDIHG